MDKIAEVVVVSENNYVIGVDYNPNETFVTLPQDYQNKLSWYHLGAVGKLR